MIRAREVMTTPVVTAHPDTPLKDVAESMASNRVSGLPIVDQDERLVGIVTESDIVREMAGAPRRSVFGFEHHHPSAPQSSPRRRTASDVMTTAVITATLATPVRELAQLMATHDVNRVPIVDGDALRGMVTRADVIRALTRSDGAVREDLLWQLEHELTIDVTRLDLAVRRGVVTIAGEVETGGDAVLARQMAMATVGVVSVDVRGLRYRVDNLSADRRARLSELSMDDPWKYQTFG